MKYKHLTIPSRINCFNKSYLKVFGKEYKEKYGGDITVICSGLDCSDCIYFTSKNLQYFKQWYKTAYREEKLKRILDVGEI